jgi:ketosteroid isomerase-like protein
MSWTLPSSSPRRIEKTSRSGTCVDPTWHVATLFEVSVLASDLRMESPVRAGDLKGVLSAHAEDIVMFDVPAPDNGVRGIDAYRETWPPFFFGWLRSGASFGIVELHVTAGDDVANAWALLRCGTEDESRKDPDTLGRVPRASLVPGQASEVTGWPDAGVAFNGGEHR